MPGIHGNPRPNRKLLTDDFLYLLVPLPLPLPLPLPDMPPPLPDGLDGDVGLVELPLPLVLPLPVAPEPARSSLMHFSRSAPVMAAHLAGTSVEELPLAPVPGEVPLEPDV